MDKLTRPSKSDKPSGGFMATFVHRPRLFVGAAIMLVTYLAFRFEAREATRLLVAWNVGA
jgi:uncharacterized membrane protein